jgi:hypothetical protein
MKPAYRRHLSFNDQSQLRFGCSRLKTEDGKTILVKTGIKPKKTLKERLKEKKIEDKKLDDKKEDKKNDEKEKRDTKSVKKTTSVKSSKSASKKRETLKKSARTSVKKEKKDEFDDVFSTDKMSDLIDDSKEYKAKTAPKTPLPLRKENNNIRGHRNMISSGIVDFNDRRKGGCFIRNASCAFDTLG